MQDTIKELSKYFAQFPGIGERQSKRFVYFLLSRDKAYLSRLSTLINNLQKAISQCPICFRYFENDNNEICDICSRKDIDPSTLAIVEKDADLESLKKSGAYKGRYFVLGGLVPVVEKDTEKFVRISELKNRIKDEIAKGSLKEIILAFSINPQGEHTDLYVRRELNSLTDNTDIRVVSLGRGLSTGTELEYSDSETLKNALHNRQ